MMSVPVPVGFVVEQIAEELDLDVDFGCRLLILILGGSGR
jgi:hypothetical protein